MSTPIDEFLKYASETRVRAHTRNVRGKTVYVDAHARTKEELTTEEQRTQALRARQAKELELWRTWKEGGMQQKDLAPLLRSFRPMIRAKVNQYANRVRIPPSAIDLNFQIEFVNALRAYDPNKGALGTYVFQYLNKGKRWITENQNIGRIPENRIYKIRKYQNAVADLAEELGREPTQKETAEALGWAEKEVDRMDSELRNDLVSQGFEDDPFALTPSKTEEVLKLFKYELEGDHRAVYEHLTGYGRPRIASTGGIAKELGLKDYQVSRIKNQIEAKLRRYLQE
jgi:DNA-directed RNA polymerase specialized sigma subunit